MPTRTSSCPAACQQLTNISPRHADVIPTAYQQLTSSLAASRLLRTHLHVLLTQSRLSAYVSVHVHYGARAKVSLRGRVYVQVRVNILIYGAA